MKKHSWFLTKLIALISILAPLICPALLRGQENEDIFNLDPFEVATEETAGYGVSSLTTATRLNTPLKDVSQTISVVTSDFMNDIAAVDFGDAIAYMPAMSVRQNVPDGSKIRGIRTTRSYQNGFRVPNYSSDMGNISHIEVIKGPSSAITGRGEPGGVVNYVTKKPLKEKQESFQFRTGSYDYFRAVYDTTGPLIAEKGLYYRAILIGQDNDLWRDFEHTTKLGFFPSVYWEINENTNVLFEGELYRSNGPKTFGAAHFTVADPTLSPPRDLRGNTPTAEQFLAAGIQPNSWQPKSLQTSEAFNHNDTDVVVFTAYLNHRFTDWLHFRQAVLTNHVKSDEENVRISNVFGIASQAFVDSNEIPGTGVGDVILDRTWQKNDNSQKNLALQGDLLFDFDLEELADSEIQFLLSYEYTEGESTAFQLRGDLQDLNVNNVVHGGRPFNIGAPVTNQRNWSDSVAYFATLQSNHFNDRLSILYGYRYDDASSERDDLRFSPTRKTFTEPPSTTADRWGVTVRPVEWLSVYHVRSNQADPEANSARFTNLPPNDSRSNERINYARTGELIETGIKAELLDRRVTLTAAKFEIKQAGFLRNTQEVETLPDGSQITFTRNFLVEGSVFEGWELEFFGAPTDRLSIFGGYSQIDTRTTADPTQVAAGLILENRGVPDYKFSLFGKYDFGNRERGYYLKGGIVLQGEQWSSLENAYKMPSTERYDIGGGFKWGRGKYTLDLTLNNISDEIIPIPVAPGSNYTAPPFQWFATFTGRF